MLAFVLLSLPLSRHCRAGSQATTCASSVRPCPNTPPRVSGSSVKHCSMLIPEAGRSTLTSGRGYVPILPHIHPLESITQTLLPFIHCPNPRSFKFHRVLYSMASKPSSSPELKTLNPSQQLHLWIYLGLCCSCCAILPCVVTITVIFQFMRAQGKASSTTHDIFQRVLKQFLLAYSVAGFLVRSSVARVG